MGAAPVRPPIPGYDRVRTLRTVEDAARLASDVDVAPATAVVIGAGFIGLEMAENLVAQGIDVTIVEATPQVLPPLDPELAILVRDELTAHGVHVETGPRWPRSKSRTVTLADGRVLPADLVVGAIGVRPDVGLAELAGLDLGPSGGHRGQRRQPDQRPRHLRRGRRRREARCHLACHVAHRPGQRGQPPGPPGGRPHRRTALALRRVPRDVPSSRSSTSWRRPSAGTSGACAPRAGPYRAIHSHPFDHATYYPGATRMAAKLIFDPNDGTILGAQIVGRNGVDKRIDVIATAMADGMTADQLADLELAYAPPFSSAKDPVNLLGYMAENILSGDCDVVAPDELAGLVEEGWWVVDVRTAEEHAAGAIPGSTNVPIDSLRDHLDDAGQRTRRRLLRGGPAGPYRDCVDARARFQGPQSRRWLPDVVGVDASSGECACCSNLLATAVVGIGLGAVLPPIL